MGRPKNTIQNVLAKFVNKTDTCWLWTGSAAKSGKVSYGKTTYNFKTVVAHRYVYEALVGKIADDIDLDHLCKNTLCVNPSHLEPVTRQENIHRSNVTKLTQEDVDEIRSSSLKQRELAEKFGVNQSQISKIKNARRWA